MSARTSSVQMCDLGGKGRNVDAEIRGVAKAGRSQ